MLDTRRLSSNTMASMGELFAMPPVARITA